jgi:menaquinone-specific isochorismate synthase
MLDISENKIKIVPNISLLQQGEVSKFISQFSSIFKDIIYFANPSSDFEVLAVGKHLSFESSYSQLGNLYKQLINKFENTDFGVDYKEIPLFFGYCKFPSTIKENSWIDFKDSEWILPEHILYKRKDGSLLISFSSNKAPIDKSILLKKTERKDLLKSVKLRPYQFDLHPEWEKRVNSAVEMINKNKLKKIVLARKKEFNTNYQIDFTEIMEVLNIEYRDCFNFLIKSNDSFFFGSSPELLAEIDNINFKSEALAGSIERGNSEIEDNYLSDFLLNDNKNLTEHQIVIDYLKSNLEDLINNFVISEIPKIKRLKNIQHLQTEIRGQIKSDVDIFNLVSKIFPTPAVCGIPKDVAINELENLENFERGIFTGIIGWFNFYKKAEFYVAIRSGLFKDNFLSVFAGCGIVQNSNALDEYKETELKLKVITDLFNVEN